MARTNVASLLYVALALIPAGALGRRDARHLSPCFARSWVGNARPGPIGCPPPRRPRLVRLRPGGRCVDPERLPREGSGECFARAMCWKVLGPRPSKKDAPRAAMSGVRRTIVYYFRIAAKRLSHLLLSLVITLSLPAGSWANHGGSLETHYHYQNNLQLGPQRTRSVITVQPYSARRVGGGVSRRPREARRRAVRRISVLVVLATFAASSYRASLRESRIVRSASPFGRIRNVSPLGNGVSVIRVCMALGFDDAAGDGAGKGGVDDAGSLLKRLHLEEKELYAKMYALAGTDVYRLRQKALGNYLSSVASAFLQYHHLMRYGSIDSIRLPFVEEAVKEFRRTSKEERRIFDSKRQMQQTRRHESLAKSGVGQLPGVGMNYLLATILLAIKGDQTSVPLPFGIIRRRDMARELSRIAKDAKADGCLVASEVISIPDLHSFEKAGAVPITHLTEKEIIKSFPGLVPLT